MLLFLAICHPSVSAFREINSFCNCLCLLNVVCQCHNHICCYIDQCHVRSCQFCHYLCCKVQEGPPLLGLQWSLSWVSIFHNGANEDWIYLTCSTHSTILTYLTSSSHLWVQDHVQCIHLSIHEFYTYFLSITDLFCSTVSSFIITIPADFLTSHIRFIFVLLEQLLFPSFPTLPKII